MAAKDERSLPNVSAETARRLLLGGQGLLADPARRASAPVVKTVIHRLGYVQIDSINVVERAHHLMLATRLDGYRPDMLVKLLERDRSLFEHWTHDASAIPSVWYPHWKHRFDRYRKWLLTHPWWKDRIGPDPEAVIGHVRERIRSEGALKSKDFEHDRKGQGQGQGWWGWKPQKAALEHLWRTGEVAIAGRENFQKVYDLAERVLGELHHAEAPSWEEHVDWACRTALERLAIATPSEIAGFWNAVKLPAAREWCAAAADRGEIVPVRVESEDGSKPRPAFAVADWARRARRLPAPPERMRLLSPFDPVLRDRARTLRLFSFDYRFEAFVPAAKRRHGYYVMPLLEGDRLAGRVRPKFDRARDVLRIERVWWEDGLKDSRARRRALEQAVERLARSIGAGDVSIARRR